MRSVAWLQEARRERAAIARRIAMDDPGAARRVVAEIKVQTSRLAEFSHIGRPGRLPGTRELSIVRTPYLVIYWVTEDAVHILRILHTRQQWP